MTRLVIFIALVIGGIVTATLALMHFAPAKVAAQRAVIPGRLSKAHAFLENNCAACHSPVKGARLALKNRFVVRVADDAVLRLDALHWRVARGAVVFEKGVPFR